MLGQRAADRAPGEHQVQHALWQTRIHQRLRQAQCEQRNSTGGFEHHGVAVHERRRDLPRRDGDREVERRDDTDDTDRLAGHQDLLAGPRRRVHGACLAVGGAAVVAQDLRGATDLTYAFGKGLAFLAGQFRAPLLGRGIDDVGGTRQHRRAGVHRLASPASRGGPRGLHGAVQLRGVGQGSGRDHLVGVCRVGVDQFACGAAGPRAVDMAE